MAIEVVHFGTEEDVESLIGAKQYLDRGENVSFIGLGTSMEPIITDGTRMVFEPYNPATEKPIIGETYFALGKFRKKGKTWYYFNTHMCIRMTRRRVLLGTPQGEPLGWVEKDNILGRYIGDWGELCQQ